MKSLLFGNASEAIEKVQEFPVVVKMSEGSGSRGVRLARNREEFESISKEFSSVFIVNNLHSVFEFMIYRISMRLFNKVQTKYRLYSIFRRKFIAQNFIKELHGDYKVIFMGRKYYVLYRENRENDFRASGSGKFIPSPEIETGLLDFARLVTLEINFPIIGMDIGFDGNNYHLLEFQCIHIGPITLQASTNWYEYENGNWIKNTGRSNLEEEFCRSVNEYILEGDNHNAK